VVAERNKAHPLGVVKYYCVWGGDVPGDRRYTFYYTTEHGQLRNRFRLYRQIYFR
jgi:hypothetical protein